MARMNPPTPGHLSLIQTLIETAIVLDIKHVYISLSKTHDNQSDPLPCEKDKESPEISFKTEIIDKMINHLKTEMCNIHCSADDTLLDRELKKKIHAVIVDCRCVPQKLPDHVGPAPTPFTPIATIVKDEYNPVSTWSWSLGKIEKRICLKMYGTRI